MLIIASRDNYKLLLVVTANSINTIDTKLMNQVFPDQNEFTILKLVDLKMAICETTCNQWSTILNFDPF